MKDEYEKESKGVLDEGILEEYKKAYIARASDHAKRGTILLMKKLLNEDFIFKDILEYLEKSHKINYYIDKLIKNFKELVKKE